MNKAIRKKTTFSYAAVIDVNASLNVLKSRIYLKSCSSFIGFM